jgi:hypothetical protein
VRSVLGHFDSIGSMPIFISLQSNVFELLAGDTGSFKFSMDYSVVYRDEVVCFEEIKKLI